MGLLFCIQIAQAMFLDPYMAQTSPQIWLLISDGINNISFTKVVVATRHIISLLWFGVKIVVICFIIFAIAYLTFLTMPFFKCVHSSLATRELHVSTSAYSNI